MIPDTTRARMIKVVNILLVLITCLWFIPSYTKGIDVTDTGFYLVKYKYVFDESVNVTSLSTVFTDLIGGAIYHIFQSHQLMILNFMGAICYTASGYFIYYVLKDYASHTLLLLSTFGCGLITLSRIHCFNYNTTSMFNLALTILLLTVGLFQEKKICIAASGLFGVVGIFLRVPNVLHLCIALGIFLYCYNKDGNKWKDVKKPLLTYIGGCVIGGVISLFIIIPTLGISGIKKSINTLYSLLTTPSNSYSTGSMLSKLPTYITNGISLWKNYILVLVLIILIAIGLCAFKKYEKTIIALSAVAACIYALYIKSAYEISTRDGVSNAEINDTFYVVILASFILCFVGIFAFYKTNRKFSYLCLLTSMLEAIITLGTNTGMLFYALFLYLPIGMLCCAVFQYYKLLKDAIPASTHITSVIGAVVLSFSITLLFFSGYARSTTYVYRNSTYADLTEQCDITPLNGLYTTPERVELLEKIEEVLEPYAGSYLITLGECNVATVISDLKPYFSTPWPDLASFKNNAFEEELYTNYETTGYPVILFSPTTVINPPAGSTYGSSTKEQMLLTFIEENDYSLVYEDDTLIVYAPNN